MSYAMKLITILLFLFTVSQASIAQSQTKEFNNKISEIIKVSGADSASSYIGGIVTDIFVNDKEPPNLDAKLLADFANKNEQENHNNIAVALHHLNAAINGESVEARLAHMNYHLRHDEIFPALEEARRLVQLEPENKDFKQKLEQIMSQRDLADIMLDDITQKGFAMGIKTYLEMKADPTIKHDYDFGLETFYKLRYQLSIRGRYFRAIEVLLFATQLYPESAETYYLLGEEYQKRGERFDETRALRAFEKVLEIEPNHKKATDAIATLTKSS